MVPPSIIMSIKSHAFSTEKAEEEEEEQICNTLCNLMVKYQPHLTFIFLYEEDSSIDVDISLPSISIFPFHKL